ncbi:MAG: MATE family efflux transporter [Tissierellia bacterium]|nr:MATE family efflux transporter [Tissierellia bacterium]
MEETQKKSYLFDRASLLGLILPLVIEQLLNILVGMADSVMVATVGEAGVSGVSLVDNIMILFINIFAALATGGAVIAGQYLGREDRKNANKAATQLLWFISIVALVITVLVYLGKPFIMNHIFGSISQEVEKNAMIYLYIVAASIPFVAIYSGAAALFRTMGDSKTSMKISLIMNGINVFGNAICIYGLHFGTEGVAIPTLVSRIFAAVGMTALLLRKNQRIYLERSFRYKPDWEMIRRILFIGIPNTLENSMFQIGKIVVLSLVSTFGTYAIAANAVGNAITLFQILPGIAINLGMIAVISRCVGAGEYEQARYYTKMLLKITYISMLVINIIVILSLPWIVKLYHLSDVTAFEVKRLVYLFGFFSVIFWPLSFTLPCTLRAAGDVKITMIISLLSMWIFRVMFSHLLGKNLGWGLVGVWSGMFIDWVVRSIFMIWRYRSGHWERLETI